MKYVQILTTLKSCRRIHYNCMKRMGIPVMNCDRWNVTPAPIFGSTHSKIQPGMEKIKQQSNTLRNYSNVLTLQKRYTSKTATSTDLPSDDSNDFMAVFPDLSHEFTEIISSKYNCKEAAKWFEKMLQYNVLRGKKYRGLLTILAYRNLVKKEQLSAENIKLAYYLGFCLEMLQCFFLVADDIMDNSQTRRGQICWHKLENVGMIAINDLLMVENAIYGVLRKHFRHLDCYVDLMESFQEITFITNCGQSLDLLNANKTIDAFTMDNYKAIVINKTAYYTFYLPFALALHLAGYKDDDLFRKLKVILLEIGYYFQVQDDYLDAFGDSTITGKIGTDIQDNKCSWLAVVAMQRANNDQKAILIECYGKNDPKKIARVMEMYKELDIPSAYTAFEEETCKTIKAHIDQTLEGKPRESVMEIVNKITRRKF